MYLYFATFWTRGFQSRWASGAWICAFSLESLRGGFHKASPLPVGNRAELCPLGMKRGPRPMAMCACVVCVCMWRNRNRQLFEPLFLPFLASLIPFLLYPSPFRKAPCPLLLLFLPKSPKSDKSPNFHRNDWLLRAIKNSTGERREKYAERSFFPERSERLFRHLIFLSVALFCF